jgi:hypothetical protein
MTQCEHKNQKCTQNRCNYWNKKEQRCYQANLKACPVCGANRLGDIVRTCAEEDKEFTCNVCNIWYGANGKIAPPGYWGTISILRAIFGNKRKW